MVGRRAGRACRQEGDSDDDGNNDNEQEAFKKRLAGTSPEARKNYALGLMAALRGDTDCRTEKKRVVSRE